METSAVRFDRLGGREVSELTRSKFKRSHRPRPRPKHLNLFRHCLSSPLQIRKALETGVISFGGGQREGIWSDWWRGIFPEHKFWDKEGRLIAVISKHSPCGQTEEIVSRAVIFINSGRLTKRPEAETARTMDPQVLEGSTPAWSRPAGSESRDHGTARERPNEIKFLKYGFRCKTFDPHCGKAPEAK